MSKSLNVGPQKPTIRYSKQMKEFLSFLWQHRRTRMCLKKFTIAKEGEYRELRLTYPEWSLQRMAKKLFDRGLICRTNSRWTHGHRYGLTEEGEKLVRERKLENYFKENKEEE